MNFFKKIFRKKESNEGPYFEFQKSVISCPSLWTSDVENTVDKLTETEKNQLYQICDFLQEAIELHCTYILGYKYTLAKLKENPQYLFKSYFELTSLNWMLITNYFTNHNVRNEVGQALSWTIKYSFSGHDNIFKKSSFKTFEIAFLARQEMYATLLNQYFKPRGNELDVNQNLFEIIIDRPLSDGTDEDELRLSFLQNFGDTEKMSNSLSFNKHLVHNIKVISQKLNHLNL